EIGEIDPNTQVKLLRVMGEDHAFERVGGNQPLRADARVVAATNKNLEKLVQEGKFRDDLFFRLNVVRITMPPLRERKEDIPLLVHGFLRHFCKANDKPLLDLAPDAMNALLAYNWPGNVRELRTAIEHGVVMATGAKITLRDLPSAVRQAAGHALPRGISSAKAFSEKSSPWDLRETEKKLILQALTTTNGNVTAAAKKLGISRRTLHRKINEINAAESPGQAAIGDEKKQNAGKRRICSTRCPRARGRQPCGMATAWPGRGNDHRNRRFSFMVQSLPRSRDFASDGPGADRARYREWSRLAHQRHPAARRGAIASPRKGYSKNLARHLPRAAAAAGRCHRSLAGKIALENDSSRRELRRRQGHCRDVDLAFSRVRRRAFLHRAPIVRQASCSAWLRFGSALRRDLAVFAFRFAPDAAVASIQPHRLRACSRGRSKKY